MVPVIAVGIVGQPLMAEVDVAGQLWLPDGSPVRWWVAAEDRWHDPRDIPATRQRAVDGAPVVETRVRVPGGDVVARVYAVANDGGTVVLEWHNESRSSVAVAIDAPSVTAIRPLLPANAQAAGIPSGAVGVPVAHGATARVVIGPESSDVDLRTLPEFTAVIAGWDRHVATAGRYGTGDPALWERVVLERSQLVLRGPVAVDPDPMAALFTMAELVRLGADAEPFVVMVADAAGRVARAGGPGAVLALTAAAEVLASAGEHRAVRDVRTLAGKVTPVALTPDQTGARWLWWLRSQLVGGGPSSVVLAPVALAPSWFGHSIEVLGEQVGPHRVGWALRWHGERPALLWEVEPAADEVTCPGIDPGFRSSGVRGDALLAAPAAVSFS